MKIEFVQTYCASILKQGLTQQGLMKSRSTHRQSNTKNEENEDF